jgi:NADPH-dependent ferric siderophore reductase
VLALVIQDHPHRPFTHLGCVPRQFVAHGSILSRFGASGKGGAIHIETTTRFVVFAADKTASDIVSDALRLHPSVFAERRLVYIADISAMPAIVTRMFALPKMRDLPFQVGLVQNSEVTSHLPRKPKEVTLIALEDQRVQAIEYLPDAASLRRSLGIASP